MKQQDERNIARYWDAGQAGCGRLIMGLQRQMKQVGDDELLAVNANDPAAQIDIPCWCHLTGHELVSETHPLYVLRKASSGIHK